MSFNHVSVTVIMSGSMTSTRCLKSSSFVLFKSVPLILWALSESRWSFLETDVSVFEVVFTGPGFG